MLVMAFLFENIIFFLNTVWNVIPNGYGVKVYLFKIKK
jgi:hypothetical protein